MNIKNLMAIYVRNNLSILKLYAKSKIPSTPHGVRDATRDAAVISDWIDKENVNLGIATGAPSGIDVLDVDGETGKKSLKLLESEFGTLPETTIVETPNNGIHFYFRHVEGLKNRVGILPGIDFRTTGGYVVAPPSKLENDKEYRIVTGLEKDEKLTFADIPQWLIHVLTDSQGEDKRLIDSDGFVTPGSRNDYLFRFGCRFWAYGITENALEAALKSENESRCLPPLDDNELFILVKSVKNYEHGNRGSKNGRNGVNFNEVEQSRDLMGGLIGSYGLDEKNASPFKIRENDVLDIKAGSLVKSMCEYLQDKDKVQGQSFYMKALDRLLGGGMREGEVTVWHALAKVGKNSVWHKLMHLQAVNKVGLGYGSRELTPETEVLPNILSIHFKENLWLSTNIFPERFQDVVDSWPIHFLRGYGYISPESLIKWVKKLSKEGIKQFWFDHLHYMLESPEDHQEASKLIKLIKTLAKSEGVHINLIVQANKLFEGQALSLNSIKGGSAIGQALDNLIILERYSTTTPFSHITYENESQIGDGKQDENDEKGIMEIRLEVGRSKLCKLGKFYVKYDSNTTDMTECDRPKEVQAYTKPVPDTKEMVDLKNQLLNGYIKNQRTPQ